MIHLLRLEKWRNDEEMKNTGIKEWFRVFAIVLLLICSVCFMFWMWRDSLYAPLLVLNGKLFLAPWRIVHAGFSLDQPTIGKWYFGTTFFSGIWLGFTVAAFYLCRSRSRNCRLVFAVLTLGTFAIYLLTLTVPFFWTLQYIYEMGFTFRRLIALLWGLCGFTTLSIFSFITIRRTLCGEQKKAEL